MLWRNFGCHESPQFWKVSNTHEQGGLDIDGNLWPQSRRPTFLGGYWWSRGILTWRPGVYFARPTVFWAPQGVFFSRMSVAPPSGGLRSAQAPPSAPPPATLPPSCKKTPLLRPKTSGLTKKPLVSSQKPRDHLIRPKSRASLLKTLVTGS